MRPTDEGPARRTQAREYPEAIALIHLDSHRADEWMATPGQRLHHGWRLVGGPVVDQDDLHRGFGAEGLVEPADQVRKRLGFVVARNDEAELRRRRERGGCGVHETNIMRQRTACKTADAGAPRRHVLGRTRI